MVDAGCSTESLPQEQRLSGYVPGVLGPRALPGQPSWEGLSCKELPTSRPHPLPVHPMTGGSQDTKLWPPLSKITQKCYLSCTTPPRSVEAHLLLPCLPFHRCLFLEFSVISLTCEQSARWSGTANARMRYWSWTTIAWLAARTAFLEAGAAVQALICGDVGCIPVEKNG